MGSCTFGSPAKTINPTRSCCRPSNNLLTAYLVRSRRLGSKSSASIEFETSTANIISTPCVFCSRRREPNCGRAATNANNIHAPQNNTNFSTTLPIETPDISSSSVAGLPKRASRRLRPYNAMKKSATKSGTTANNQRKCGFAKRNMTVRNFRKRITECGSTRSATTGTRRPTTPVRPAPSSSNARDGLCGKVPRFCSFPAG